MTTMRVDSLAYTLLSSAGAAGAGASVKIPGGMYMFLASGTIGASTLQMEVEMPNGVWVTVQVFTGSLVRFTALPASQTAIDLPAGNVRANLVGGTPSGVSAYLVGLG